MNSPIALGLVCGFVSALLMGSAVAQNAVAYALVCLVPLPVFLAGLGWGVVASVTALVAGSLIVSVFLGSIAAPVFLIFFGSPAALLSYLTLKHRRAPDGRPLTALDWFSAGTLVAATALIAGALAAGLMLVLGDQHYYGLVRAAVSDAHFKALFARFLGLPPGIASHRIEMPAYVILPAAMSALWCGLLLTNLWLGLKVVQVAGRLARPAPQFMAMHFPAVFLLAGLLCTGAGFLPGMGGRAALCFAGGFAAAYLLLGFVIVCVLTARLTWQAFLFVLLAAAFTFFGRATLAVMIGAGIADTVFNFRKIPRTPPAVAERGPTLS
jgi:hypothetical protein